MNSPVKGFEVATIMVSAVDCPKCWRDETIRSKANKKSNNEYMSGGNFYDVFPYEGRYDAQSIACFYNSKAGFNWLPESSLASIPGQVRDIKRLKTTGSGELIVVARNDQPLLFIKSEE